MNQQFFIERPSITPTIYAYELVGVSSHKGYIKVGYTERDAETRIAEQMHTSGVPYRILFKESAMCPDGSCFTDHDVHRILRRKGIKQLNAGEDRNEWFNCSVDQVRSAIEELRSGIITDASRTASFKMRPEQERAVMQTIDYFNSAKRDEPGRIPKFLWNAKMRFGKTFASYQLARKMGFKRVLVLTFKPAVESAWREDLLTHVDFDGWQFISNKDAHNNNINIDEQFELADKSKPIVVFGSFQDLLGTNEAGGIKAKNEFIHITNWDLVIFDEYHFGAWRDNAKKLFDNPDEEENADFDAERYQKEEAGNAYNESWIGITTNYYLFLSGTPFRAINSGEFIEDQIYNWTYSDEQRAKTSWLGSENPYASLPRMVMLTYRIPDSIKQIAMQGEFDEFDLNVFFSAKGKGEDARFVYKNEVQKWLDLIRGAYLPSSVDDMKLGQDKRPPMPYSDTRLLNVLSHTLWFLPNVASCFAMYNLLMQKQNAFYRDYKINVCAGTKAGIGLDALAPVQASMGNPLGTKTITLSCGKLTTGVTVKPWTGIFMLRNLKSPETYFQAAFRVQSPWEVVDDKGNRQIMKQECYVFDFALDRALRQISDYSCRLNVEESNPEKKVAEFISFLPVLAYKSMRKQIQEKLIKFATRVPVFMYLTDYRERSLKDVITQLEPGLFKKVTGLDVKDFNLLCSIGVFNASLMNDAIFKFKRYEDSSLSYTGIDKHAGEDIGGWDTVIRREEYKQLFYNQQKTMEASVTFSKVIEEEVIAPIQKEKKPIITRRVPELVTAAYGIKSQPVALPAQPKKEEPEIDLSGVAVGVTVTHKVFGEGTVIWMDKAKKYLRVAFGKNEKQFIFPDAFKQGFLIYKE